MGCELGVDQCAVGWQGRSRGDASRYVIVSVMSIDKAGGIDTVAEKSLTLTP
jgi:hypothetical protein